MNHDKHMFRTAPPTAPQRSGGHMPGLGFVTGFTVLIERMAISMSAVLRGSSMQA